MEYSVYKKLCFLDIETTNIYWSSCAPIQIAAIICDADGNIEATFNERIKTTHKISPDASAVHGIYKEDLVNCRTEYQVLTDFCLWLRDYETDAVVTYNGEVFDRPVLNERCKTLGIPFNYFSKEEFPGVDCKGTVMEAKRRNLFNLKDLGRKWKLTLVSEKLGFSSENAHDAFADVCMLKNVFFKLDPIINPQNWTNVDSGVSLF